MEWTESLKRAIDYVEKNLLDEDLGAGSVAEEIHISSFYLQKGFTIMTGYTLGEYIKNRKLYLAAMEILAGKEKIIDIAYKYGYSTPESFSKAFVRFHGVPPVKVIGDSTRIKPFLPLRISVQIKGGNDMDFTIERVKGLKLIGFEGIFSSENGYVTLPKFWDEIRSKYMMGGDDACSKAVRDNCIGEYGVCIDDIPGGEEFRYMIAGEYQGGEVPEGLTIFELPEMTWAKFNCTGPMPGALQTVNTAIFKEWLPGNPEYEMAEGFNIEWYSMGDMSSKDYKSSIWIPVRHK